MKITCIERTYKIQDNKIIYFIVAKRELDEELTDKLLHEDMELKTFLGYYEITDFQKDEDISGTEEILDISKIKARNILEIEEKKSDTEAKTAKFPSPIKREWVILHIMPEEFALEDIAKFYKDNEEDYDIRQLKMRFSSTLQVLKKQNKIEVINPDVNRRFRRYRRLVNENREFDKMINGMKKDRKTLMGTMK